MLYSMVPSGNAWYPNKSSFVNDLTEPFNIRTYPSWGNILHMLWWEMLVDEADNSANEAQSAIENYNLTMGLPR